MKLKSRIAMKSKYNQHKNSTIKEYGCKLLKLLGKFNYTVDENKTAKVDFTIHMY